MYGFWPAILIILMVTNACGPQGQQLRNSGDPRTNRETTTGAVNANDKPYTTYNPESEIKEIKDNVALTDQNRAFGQQIERASISHAPTDEGASLRALEVRLKWRGVDQPLVFQGQLAPQGTFFDGQLQETTGQKSEIAMTAQCAELQCDHAKLIVYDADHSTAGIVITKEERTLKLKTPVDQKSAPMDQILAHEYKDGKPVVVTSTQIFPGKSYYEITEKTSDAAQTAQLKLSGELVEPAGDCVPVDAGNDQRIGKTCLIGNDEAGDLLFKLEPKNSNPTTGTNKKSQKSKSPKSPLGRPQGTVYLELAPRQDPKGATPSDLFTKPNCPVKTASTNELVRKILEDCGNSDIEKAIKTYWSPRVRTLRGFLNYNQLRLSDHPVGTPDEIAKAKDLKTMMGVLSKYNFPEVWALVTIRESDFNKMAVGTSGEYGYWQIMADTARLLGLRTVPTVSSARDERRDTARATDAAARYYKDLLVAWDGDVKMALASYNRGTAGMRSASSDLQKKINAGKIDIGDDLREAFAISKDFWYIYRLHMAKHGQNSWDYVPQIIAAFYAATAPQAYGLLDVGTPMEMK